MFVKINRDTYVNLDHVAAICTGKRPPVVLIVFANVPGKEDGVELEGNEAEQFLAFLEKMTSTSSNRFRSVQ